ncbi:S-layer homology domain-containing protein [Paenibacillus sp. YYML68]|uniref:S-layer homology domain-containing protein n=1 Tax=Paenibacillus sp. YYML68 TaxID=2909250 RepID=UPI00248F522B|nr:S-layer homology domain-containing protein [Paenibacillus sp. YYML68]
MRTFRHAVPVWLMLVLLLAAGLSDMAGSSRAEAAVDGGAAYTVSSATYSTRLSQLNVYPAAGAISFHPDTLVYSTTVPHATSTIRLLPLLEDETAVLEINARIMKTGENYDGSLSVGPNVFTLTVTAANKQYRTYTVTVHREQGSTESHLRSLTFSTGRLYPSFSSDETSYTLYVEHPIKTVYMSALLVDSKATLTYNGSKFPEGVSVYNAKPLEPDKPVLFDIVVTAEHGNTRTYSVVMKRAALTTIPTPRGSGGFYEMMPVTRGVTEVTKERFGRSELTIEVPLDPYRDELEDKKKTGVIQLDAVSHTPQSRYDVKLLPALWKKTADTGKTLQLQTHEFDLTLSPRPLPAGADDTGVLLSIEAVAAEQMAEWASIPPSVDDAAAAYRLSLDSFGEHDATWSKPLAFSFKLSHKQISQAGRLAAYRYDEGGRSWTFVGGQLTTGNRFEVELTSPGLIAIVEDERSFSDTAGHWAEGIIAELTTRRIASGVGEGRFAPDTPVTRAEFASMLARALELTSSGPVPFTDVPADAWYRDDLGKAVAAKLIEGVSESSFQPGETIKREQMAAMLMRAHSLRTGIRQDDILLPAKLTFADESSASAWAVRSIRLVEAVGIMNGAAGGAFLPQHTATRAEAVAVVYRLMNLHVPAKS